MGMALPARFIFGASAVIRWEDVLVPVIVRHDKEKLGPHPFGYELVSGNRSKVPLDIFWVLL